MPCFFRSAAPAADSTIRTAVNNILMLGSSTRVNGITSAGGGMETIAFLESESILTGLMLLSFPDICKLFILIKKKIS